MAIRSSRIFFGRRLPKSSMIWGSRWNPALTRAASAGWPVASKVARRSAALAAVQRRRPRMIHAGSRLNCRSFTRLPCFSYLTRYSAEIANFLEAELRRISAGRSRHICRSVQQLAAADALQELQFGQRAVIADRVAPVGRSAWSVELVRQVTGAQDQRREKIKGRRETCFMEKPALMVTSYQIEFAKSASSASCRFALVCRHRMHRVDRNRVPPLCCMILRSGLALPHIRGLRPARNRWDMTETRQRARQDRAHVWQDPRTGGGSSGRLSSTGIVSGKDDSRGAGNVHTPVAIRKLPINYVLHEGYLTTILIFVACAVALISNQVLDDAFGAARDFNGRRRSDVGKEGLRGGRHGEWPDRHQTDPTLRPEIGDRRKDQEHEAQDGQGQGRQGGDAQALGHQGGSGGEMGHLEAWFRLWFRRAQAASSNSRTLVPTAMTTNVHLAVRPGRRGDLLLEEKTVIAADRHEFIVEQARNDERLRADTVAGGKADVSLAGSTAFGTLPDGNR